MRIFKISKEIEVVCNSENTRSGFRHLASLFIDGKEQESEKICYLNRTWERYEFQSVLKRLVEKSEVLSEEQKKVCSDFIDGDQTDWSDFKLVSQVAKMGEVLCKDKKEKNDWKARMLKAGLENKGLIMPDDWDELDEDTKEARLNAVLAVVGSK